MPLRTNLIDLASDIAREEGLTRSAGGTPQVLEILGLLGSRWRGMTTQEVLREVSCIVERSGLRSAHLDGPTNGDDNQ